MIKLPRVRVQDSKGQYDETLTCIDFGSFSRSIEMNQTHQIEFTANNDNSLGYQLLQNENYLIFDDQKYHIKQADKEDSNRDIKRSISATHIWFDSQYVYQYDKIKGDKTVTAADLMSFVFDKNSLGNNGFTWEIVGDIPKVQVTDYGEKSGLDCINDCIEKFNLVVVPDNKHIKLVAMDNWKHKTNKTFRYIHDTPEFKVSIDTTELQNIVMCYGKTKDKDSSSTSDPVDSETGTAVGTVNTMDPDGVAVYSTPGDEATIVQHLPNGSHWLVDSKRTIDSNVYYRVSSNGWVSDKDITFDKTGDIKPENHIITDVLGRGTIKAADNTSATDNTGTVTDDGSTTEHQAPTEANVYDSPWSPQTKTRILANGTPWRINGEVTEGALGKTWYRVSTNEWVAEEDFDFSGDEDIQPKELDKPDTDDVDDTSDDETEYYFDPFIVKDQKSIDEWGSRPGAPISDERFTDVNSMKEYALSSMKSEPEVNISITYNGDEKLLLGDMAYIEVKPENFTTWATVTAVKDNPLSYNNQPEISLDSTPQTLIDYELSIQNSIRSVRGVASSAMSAVDTLAGNSWGSGTITRKVGEVDD